MIRAETDVPPDDARDALAERDMLIEVQASLIEVLEARNAGLEARVAELGNGWRCWSGPRRGTRATPRWRRLAMTSRAAGRRGRSGARQSGQRGRSGSGASSPAARGRRCGGRTRTGPRTTTRGGCECGLDLSEAADLGIARSYQQEEVPAAQPERVQHDLHEARCACGKEHVAPRPPGVPDAALSIGPRLRALAVYLVVFQHVPVERCRELISDVAGVEVSRGSSTPAWQGRPAWRPAWCG